jgi:hypothetical protein
MLIQATIRVGCPTCVKRAVRTLKYVAVKTGHVAIIRLARQRAKSCSFIQMSARVLYMALTSVEELVRFWFTFAQAEELPNNTSIDIR